MPTPSHFPQIRVLADSCSVSGSRDGREWVGVGGGVYGGREGGRGEEGAGEESNY